MSTSPSRLLCGTEQHFSGIGASTRTRAEPLVTVFVTVAMRTSPGPGVRRVPASEAGRLVSDHRAVYGSRPPRGFSDGGAQLEDAARMMPR